MHYATCGDFFCAGWYSFCGSTQYREDDPSDGQAGGKTSLNSTRAAEMAGHGIVRVRAQSFLAFFSSPSFFFFDWSPSAELASGPSTIFVLLFVSVEC